MPALGSERATYRGRTGILKRLVLVAALVAVPLFVWIAYAAAPKAVDRVLVQDAFLAFDCGGKIAAAGGNPYRLQPLLACEQAAPRGVYPPGIVEPAPLPGYALAFFSLFRWFDFSTAAFCWTTLSLMAIVVATWALARATGLPWYPIAAALAPNAAFFNLVSGELAPICIAALSLSALLLARRRYVGAALAAAVTMIEPHVGLAACLALFLFAPKTRLTLVLAGLACGAASIAAVGLTGTAEYFQAVLPAHARSELLANDQFSLTWVLHELGVPAEAALRAGSISYAVMLVLGLVLARPWAAALRSPELIVTLPPAAVLIGGVFIHGVQMPIALPAALFLAARCRPSDRPLAFAGVALIAIPWEAVGGGRLIAALSLAVLLTFALDGRFGRPWPRRLATAAAGTILVAFLASHAPPAQAVSVPSPLKDPNAPASANWQQYVAASHRPTTPDAVARKALVWSGFLAVALAGASSCGALGGRLPAPQEPAPAAARIAEPRRVH